MAFLAASSAAAEVGSAILALALRDVLPEPAGSSDGFVLFRLFTSFACAIMLCRWSSAKLQLVSWPAVLLCSFVALSRLLPAWRLTLARKYCICLICLKHAAYLKEQVASPRRGRSLLVQVGQQLCLQLELCRCSLCFRGLCICPFPRLYC